VVVPLVFLFLNLADPVATTAPIPAATAAPISAGTSAPRPIATTVPEPVLGGGWQPTALRPQEYVSFTRHERDGTVSNMSATRQVCDCQPADAASDLQAALARLPNMLVKRDSAPICGIPATRLVVTDAPVVGRQMNFEVFIFRGGEALYGIRYYFKAATPASADEALMPLLCPRDFTAA
jgi:hypothetical protein